MVKIFPAFYGTHHIQESSSMDSVLSQINQVFMIHDMVCCGKQ